jgi:hypothetical protein
MPSRLLRLTSPHLQGPDVRELQIALNKRLNARNLNSIGVDGDYGLDTAAAYEQVAWMLGLEEATIRRGATVGAQRIIEDPSTRNERQLKAAKRRQESAATGGRVAQKTVTWCRSKVGITEHPPQSNKGPQISTWEREFGLGAVFWCGVFVGYALRRVAGIPVPQGIVYTPNILNWARSHTNGFEGLHSWQQAKLGDLILMDFGESRDPVEHVGIYAGDGRTIEGNTSSGPGGPQSNGGGVFIRERPASVIVGAARPRYPR